MRVIVVVVQSLSCVWLFATPWTVACLVPPCPSLNPGVCSDSCALSRWCHPTISSSAALFSFCLQSFQHQGLFQWAGSLHQVAKVSELYFQHQFFQWIFRVDFLWDWPVWSPCCPKNSQRSSPAPQFQRISSLALSLPYGLTLTSVPDYRKNHSFDYMDLCQQSDVSAF